jgi:hypothetical protein
MLPKRPLENCTKRLGRYVGGTLLCSQEFVRDTKICGDFSRFLVCRGRENGSEDEMAVDAVWSELLSATNSRYQGKIQGIFVISAWMT